MTYHVLLLFLGVLCLLGHFVLLDLAEQLLLLVVLEFILHITFLFGDLLGHNFAAILSRLILLFFLFAAVLLK